MGNNESSTGGNDSPQAPAPISLYATETITPTSDTTGTTLPPSPISETTTETHHDIVPSSSITGRTQAICPSFKSGWHIHLRPTWNTSFGTAVGVLRATARGLPRDIATIRFVTDTSIPTWLPTLPKGVKIVNSNRPPKGVWYLPEGKGGNDPNRFYILYIHGGAFCLCKPESHAGILMRVVEATGAYLFAPSYRRPPEYPYPIPVEDCLKAYEHMLQVLHIHPSRIILAGDSAGGGLVIQTIIHARRMGLPGPAGAILLSPWVDLTDETTSDSWKRNINYDYLPPDLARMFATLFRGDHCWEEVCASMLPDAELAQLPPLLIEFGECEVLHDQILAFAHKCISLGITVQANARDDMVHVFPMFCATGMPQCMASYNAIATFSQQLMMTSSTYPDK